MKIYMVTPEMTPYAKVGGLADVLGALPFALAQLGHEVKVVLPLYGSVKRKPHWHALEGPLVVHLGKGNEYCRVWQATAHRGKGSVDVYFLEHDDYFGRPEIYAGPWGDHADNGQRFTFLSRAALDLCYKISWMPDVLHTHDWTTALVPVYLNTLERYNPLGKVASVFTLHNLQHQGFFGRDILEYAGLPLSEYRPDSLESVSCLNMAKGGIYHSTKITTVSPNYASEIQCTELGCGLDETLDFKAADLVGIINGIDTNEWNAQDDPLIAAPFSANDLSGKITCKRELQERFGLEQEVSIPIFAVVSRLYDQKGLDIFLHIIDWLMATMRIQIVVLGTGENALESGFSQKAQQYPGRVGAYIGYSNELSHKITAGSDCFLMPSRFEPCGLAQLYAMRYGTLPVVRSTGGLADTVSQYREGQGRGTGFVFDILSHEALYYTIGWACATYYDRPEEFRQLQHNAMSQDFSWDQSALRYEQVYQWAREAR